MSTIDALADLPNRLAGHEIHAAFVVVIDMDGRPKLWFAERAGTSHPVTAYRTPGDGDEARREVRPASFALADVKLAADYLSMVARAMRYISVRSLSEAHEHAIAALDDQNERLLQAELARARALPHACRCGRRFRTSRGLAMHVARARRGQHARSES